MIERDNQREKTRKPEPKQVEKAEKGSQQEGSHPKKAVDDTKREEVQDKDYAKRIEEKTEKH